MTSKIDKNALVFSAQLQLKKYGEFIDEYSQTLDLILERHSDGQKLFKPHRVISVVNNDDLESTSLFQIIDSDNKVLSKILITFAWVFDELRELKSEAKTLQLNFVLMDESLAELETQCDDKAQLKSFCLSRVQFGNVLEMLFNVKYFIEYVSNIVCVTIRQLGALFEVEKQYINISKSIHFQSVFHHIAELLVIVITFQDLVQNASLSNYWQFYKQAINSIKYNLDEFDVKYEKSGIIGVENVLRELEQLLLGDLFEQLLLLLSNVKDELSPKTLGVFSGHVFSYIKTTLADIIKADTESNENFDALSIVKVTSISVMYHHLFGNFDKALFRQVLEVNLKHCVITLLGNHLWQVEKFLNKHAASLMKGRERMTAEMMKNRQNYLSQRNQSIVKDTRQFFNDGNDISYLK